MKQQTQNNTTQENEAVTNEHKSWLVIFNELEQCFKVSHEDLNKAEYKPLFIAIEQWGYWESKRRKAQRRTEEKRGLFWKGEDIEVIK